MTAGALLVLTLLQQPGTDGGAIAESVARGIREGVYPGAVVVVGRRDTVLYARAFGRTTWSRTSPVPSVDQTRWDLASLTKVMATTSALMVLVDRGQVDLDAPVARYLPRFDGEARRSITVRMLLDHTSGLRPYAALYAEATTKQAAIARLYREQPVRPVGTTAVYSDLNAILLGLVVESVTGERLDAVVAEDVVKPLRLGATAFAPALSTGTPVAPSRTIGGRAVPGRVNDQNAWRLGSVAGHAGLFATGSDVARFAQAWLREGRLGDTSWVSSGVMGEFLQRSAHSGSRALGWDTPETGTVEPSNYGRLASARTYGHTGWTGTLLWIDPDRDLFLVFLTNRSLAPRAPHSITALRKIRSGLSDLVIRTFGR